MSEATIVTDWNKTTKDGYFVDKKNEYSIFWRRVGDSIELFAKTATEDHPADGSIPTDLKFYLPDGVVIDESRNIDKKPVFLTERKTEVSGYRCPEFFVTTISFLRQPLLGWRAKVVCADRICCNKDLIDKLAECCIDPAGFDIYSQPVERLQDVLHEIDLRLRQIIDELESEAGNE